MAPAHGELVPLSVPATTPQLRQLRYLRLQAAELSKRMAQLATLEKQLESLNDEPRYDSIVPVASGSTSVYARGAVTDTNTVLVHFPENGSVTQDKQDGYWVEYSAKQARAVASRRRENLQTKASRIHVAIADEETSLSAQMGFSGGRVNDNFELVNEEGLPFMDIQELEEDETPAVVHKNDDRLDQHFVSAAKSIRSAAKARQETSSEPGPSPPKKPKKVSFAENESDSEDDPSTANTRRNKGDIGLPVIASAKAAASASLSTSQRATGSTIEQAGRPLTATDITMKSAIVERDSTRPPPVLTAAERSARAKTKFDVAADFDGVAQSGRKVDLSAYLPKTLRGHGIAGGSAKSSADHANGASMTAEDDENGGDGSDAGEEYFDDDSDEDYYYEDEEDDEDDENFHIDDVLAMREAALEYHKKRHALGAGAGSGPLGGFGGQHDFDEPGPSEIDKAGLPFVDTYEEDPSGQRRPSKFRQSRLQTGRMVIPSANPSDVDINENLLEGDSLGPYTEAGSIGAAAVEGGTDDFKGMSKGEIETFLRYVKALEMGEDLQDLRIVPAMSATKGSSTISITGTERGPAPPTIRSTVPVKDFSESAAPSVNSMANDTNDTAVDGSTSIKSEKPSLQAHAAPPAVANAPPTKRVSRFRAARSGDA